MIIVSCKRKKLRNIKMSPYILAGVHLISETILYLVIKKISNTDLMVFWFRLSFDT